MIFQDKRLKTWEGFSLGPEWSWPQKQSLGLLTMLFQPSVRSQVTEIFFFFLIFSSVCILYFCICLCCERTSNLLTQGRESYRPGQEFRGYRLFPMLEEHLLKKPVIRKAWKIPSMLFQINLNRTSIYDVLLSNFFGNGM